MGGSKSFNELISMLLDFSPGDLVGSIEIAEAAEGLSKLKGVEEAVTDACAEISEYFNKIVKEGTEDNTVEEVRAYADNLKKIVPTEKKEQSGEEQSQSADDEGDYEVLVSFIQEAQDHLENIEEEILRLEDGNDPVVVNDIFRSMHTIKGVSSFIGLNKIKNLSHSLESVLDELRVNKIEIGSDLIDLLLAGTDMLTKMVQELDMKAQAKQAGEFTGGTLDSEMDIDPIVDALDHVKDGKAGEESAAGGEGLITPEMVERFTEESNKLLTEVEEALKKLREDPEDKDVLADAFRTMHTIKGNAGFLGYRNIEQVCVNIETVLDQLRKGEQEYSESVLEVLLESIGAIKEGLVGVAEGEGDENIVDKPLGEALIDVGGVPREAVEQALEMQQRRLGEILVDEGKVQPDVIEKALTQQRKMRGEGPAEGVSAQRKDIRVDTEKLDKLFDLMGELITTEAMVIDNPELEQHDLDKFYLDSSNLSKITREMQEITMAIRMIPLEGLFNKMRRLVRDLSRKFEKEVNFNISGQDTEMDRNVMEEISDPLVHIIRNAIDHGIETKEKREAAGKDPTGNIWLNARYEGNEIWITVKDDGQGLNRKKILSKAVSHGIVEGDVAASMPDKEVWPLIFEPGFSTADQVSEISGRGVGMDVVKRNIEKLRGKVDISTESGKGSEIVMRIPLTLAIIDGITVTVGNMMYTIPISDIISFHKVEAGQLTTTQKEGEVLNLRGEILPIIKLHRVFRIETDKKEVSDGIVIIVLSDGKQAAVLVDEIIGNKQVVIKALPEEMGDMEGVSGCTIMGNGEVSLIIDTNTLLQRVLV